MKPEEIHLNDWKRWLMGEVPPEFLIEVVLRTAAVFLILIVFMRLFGKRMAAQQDRVEMAGMVALAAAIGVPIQAPDRGLLPAVVIAIVVVLIGRLVTKIAFQNQKFEAATHGDVGTLVIDGVMDVKQMLAVRVSRERLFAELRSLGVKHLGEVKRLYVEAGGNFSLLRDAQPKAGLSVLPDWDKDFRSTQQPQKEAVVCNQCGMKETTVRTEVCPNCGSDGWEQAVC